MKTHIALIIFSLGFTINTLPQNWSTWGGNNRRNGLTELTGPDSVTNPYWTVTSTNSLWGNSVFSFNDRFVTTRVTFSPSYTATVECRKLTDGGLLWSKQVYSTSVMYPIGFTEDAVYVNDYSSDSLYALSPDDGSVKWAVHYYTFGGNSGLVYACNRDPIIFGKRLNKETGETVWSYDYTVPAGPDAGYALNNEIYYHWYGTINTDKKLFALDAETGQFKYESVALPGDGDQEYPITIGEDGTIYLCRDGGHLYAFEDDGTSLNIKWEYTPDDPAGVRGNFGSDQQGNIYIIDNGFVKYLSKTDGRILNTSSSIVSGFYPTITVDAEGKVFINNSLDSQGKAYCFSADLQTLIWQMSIPNINYCGVSLSKDGTMLLFGSGIQIKAYKKSGTFKPVSDFSANNTRLFAGENINFFDQSSYQPAEWNWQFPGANPPSSNDQNPQNIVYPLDGMYDVTLITSNSFGIDTLVKDCYIEVSTLVFVDQVNNTPLGYILDQSYPNPFNPKTIIDWEIPKACYVTLKVYDILGNEVAELVNGYKSAGNYKTEFSINSSEKNASSSGVYFYRLNADGFMQTRKMILSK
jgi:Secretion system C-terminal sorting domain